MAETEIDIPSPLIDFIAAHEIHCVAGCCGEDAFDYSPEAIAENEWTERSVAALDLDLARRQVEEFRERAKSCHDEPSNDRINRYWEDGDAVDQWCDMIRGLIGSCEAHLKAKAEQGKRGNGGQAR
ncbi:DUF6331 family protein [Luteolibacter marinus]|uniref:DUF6331 family protein n=1 Tax=Luteolibacter marinus TaxID=2776705 RepID=UPI001866548B|nr:DUF6331 family protein [Luteolibacter marinus]